MSERIGFDKWYYKYPEKCDVREWKEKDNTNQYYKIKEAWDFKEKAIKELKEQLKRERACVDFYANYNWGMSTPRVYGKARFAQGCDDYSKEITGMVFGKLARETQKARNK